MNGLLGYNSDSGDGDVLKTHTKDIQKQSNSNPQRGHPVHVNGKELDIRRGRDNKSMSRSPSKSPARDSENGSPVPSGKYQNGLDASIEKAVDGRSSREGKLDRRTAKDKSSEHSRRRSRSSSREPRRRRSRSTSRDRRRRISRSPSRERRRKSRSRSNSRERKYRRGSRSSRSPERKRRSRSNSRERHGHRRSRTPNSNRSKSRRSRSRERRRRRSRSRSPRHDRRSRSRSPRRFSPKRRMPPMGDRRKTICRAVLPPSFGKEKDHVPTTEEVEAKLKAHMEKMKEKASEDAKNVNLPSYLNPAMVNVQQFKQQQEKRKLLWSSKKVQEEPTAAVETGVQGASWSGSTFQDDETEAKFRRLMGIKGSQNVNAGSQAEKSRKVLEDLEREYERSRAFQLSRGAGGTTGIGLGFNQAP